jgi:four helix bundle protein
MESSFEFAHDRLRVYQLAREFLAAAAEFVSSLPRSESGLRDQLRRAADSVLLNTAEGAGRSGGPDKARFYDYARGSGTECAAILDVFAIRGLASAERVEQARGVLHQIVSILTALARNARSRAG